jgi:osmotically-inducible protein OsmY
VKLSRLATLIALSAASAQIAGCGYGELVRLYFQEQEYQKDQELIAEIKGALLADPQIRRAPVQVEAYLGTVRLSGTVSLPDQKQRAQAITEQVDDVESVDNDLIVQEP